MFLLLLSFFVYAQAIESGCMVSVQAAIVPTSATTVTYDDNRAPDGVTRLYYDKCIPEYYLIEVPVPGGIALKSMEYGTYLEPYVTGGKIKIRLSADPYPWQKEIVSGYIAYYTEDTDTFGERGKYLSCCWDWLKLVHRALGCERFEFQYPLPQ